MDNASLTRMKPCTAGLASSRRLLTAGSASSRPLSTPARNPSPKPLHLYGSTSLRLKPFTACPKPFPEAPSSPDLPPPDPSPLRPETLPRSPFTYGSASLRPTPFTAGPKSFPEAPSPPDLPPPDPSPLRPKPFTSGPKHFSEAPSPPNLPPPDAPPPWPNLYLWPEAPSPKPHHLRPEAPSPPPEGSHRRPNPSTPRLLHRPKPLFVPRAEIRHGVANRILAKTFQHSGETISRHFNNVLRGIVRLKDDYIMLPSSNAAVHPRIRDNPNFHPFKMNRTLKMKVEWAI
ncbi:hypothetical protein ACMD2_20962 [Ananas comosus]|uniref:DUF8040 domain-containing protein n=1 Tax=Ananas comosus TaxID=4615 RepID=A0A199US89_ANACO|nr:hypothetical protein ACMD2_20962 [Ananas comosus]